MGRCGRPTPADSLTPRAETHSFGFASRAARVPPSESVAARAQTIRRTPLAAALGSEVNVRPC